MGFGESAIVFSPVRDKERYISKDLNVPGLGWNVKPRGAGCQKRSPLTAFDKSIPAVADNPNYIAILGGAWRPGLIISAFYTS